MWKQDEGDASVPMRRRWKQDEGDASVPTRRMWKQDEGDASVPTPLSTTPAPTGTEGLLELTGTFRDVLCFSILFAGRAFSYYSFRRSTKTGSPLRRKLKAMRVQPSGQEGCTV